MNKTDLPKQWKLKTHKYGVYYRLAALLSCFCRMPTSSVSLIWNSTRPFQPSSCCPYRFSIIFSSLSSGITASGPASPKSPTVGLETKPPSANFGILLNVAMMVATAPTPIAMPTKGIQECASIAFAPAARAASPASSLYFADWGRM